MKNWLSIVFNGTQALSAFVLMVLALWAVFFTSLPEVLITQLRSEVAEAKSEVTLLRQQRFRIEGERDDATSELSELLSERDRLAISIGRLEDKLTEQTIKLERVSQDNHEIERQKQSIEDEIRILIAERSELLSSLEHLRNERELYAGQTLVANLNKVAAYACYKLSSHFFDANIAVNYGQHRTWLNANREVSRRRAAYNALPFRDRYSDANKAAVEFRRLEELARSKPEIWYGLPAEPSLNPNAESELVSPHFLKLLNSMGNDEKDGYKKIHSYLINLFFDRTVQSEEVRRLHAESFIAELKSLDFLEDLLAEEREQLNQTLDKIISENPELQGLVVNVVYDVEPSAAEIPIGARKIVSNLELLRDQMKAFFSSHGAVSFGECRF